MLQLNNLPTLLKQGQTVIAIETHLTERFKILELLHKLARTRELPLYFWNQGYSQLQHVDNSLKLQDTNKSCKSGLDWLLQNPEIPGIFAFEGVILPDITTGILTSRTKTILSNLFYDLSASTIPRFLICLESYVELTVELVPLIPVLINPLPNAIAVKNFVQYLCNSQFSINSSTQQIETLARTCLGLPMGELEILFSRLLRFSHTLEEVIDGVLAYKKSKLKTQGIEFMSEPDVPQAAGLDLLEEILERAAVLLKPEAKKDLLQKCFVV